MALKGEFTQKWVICHYLLTLMFTQTCMIFLKKYINKDYNKIWPRHSSNILYVLKKMIKSYSFQIDMRI